VGKLELIEIKIPNLGEAESTEVIEVSINPGDSVSANDTLIVLESEKAAMEVPSDYSGVITKVLVKEGDSVQEGMTLAFIESSTSIEKSTVEDEVLESHPVPSEASNEKIQETRDFSGINAGPAVRKVARELDLDLSKIKGSGKNNLITKEDLKTFVKHGMSQKEISFPNLDELKKYGDYELIQQTKIKQLGAQNLYNSWISIPHVTHFEEANIVTIENKRKKINATSKTKVTPLAFIVQALSKALIEYPIFNSSLVGKGEIMIRKYINIGIAVNTTDGLVVPVIHDVDKLDVETIAEKINELSEKAKNKKLLSKDIQGATFSISSLGNIGGTGFTPIINPPEVGIIGVSRVKNYSNDLKILPFTLSYDHRVINGVDAGLFMSSIKDLLESN